MDATEVDVGRDFTIVQGAVDAPPMGLLGSDVVESVLLGVVSSFSEVLQVDELFARSAAPYVGHAANLP